MCIAISFLKKCYLVIEESKDNSRRILEWRSLSVGPSSKPPNSTGTEDRCWVRSSWCGPVIHLPVSRLCICLPVYPPVRVNFYPLPTWLTNSSHVPCLTYAKLHISLRWELKSELSLLLKTEVLSGNEGGNAEVRRHFQFKNRVHSRTGGENWRELPDMLDHCDTYLIRIQVTGSPRAILRSSLLFSGQSVDALTGERKVRRWRWRGEGRCPRVGARPTGAGSPPLRAAPDSAFLNPHPPFRGKRHNCPF